MAIARLRVRSPRRCGAVARRVESVPPLSRQHHAGRDRPLRGDDRGREGKGDGADQSKLTLQWTSRSSACVSARPTEGGVGLLAQSALTSRAREDEQRWAARRLSESVGDGSSGRRREGESLCHCPCLRLPGHHCDPSTADRRLETGATMNEGGADESLIVADGDCDHCATRLVAESGTPDEWVKGRCVSIPSRRLVCRTAQCVRAGMSAESVPIVIDFEDGSVSAGRPGSGPEWGPLGADTLAVRTSEWAQRQNKRLCSAACVVQ